ncbi:MAG TPA: motility protein A [Spirochaetota bacterium]|nr:motility protein A [Spirochaetota bacterium]
MDYASIIGVMGALFFVSFGIVTGGGELVAYLDLASVFITIGGSTMATFASHPFRVFIRIITVFKIAIFYKPLDPAQTILTLLSFSEKARREGLLALEDDLEETPDAFMRSGIQLVVDGTEPELVKNIMQGELDSIDERHNKYRQMFADLGEFAPAFGMIGTLIGLIVMMKNLGGDMTAVGRGMAAALITTLYGAILANSVYIPISNKLEKINDAEIAIKEIVIEGTLSIQSGDNPRILQQKLVSYFPADVRAKIEEQIGE